VGLACIVVLLGAGCAAATSPPGAVRQPDAPPSTVIVPRSAPSSCALPTAERCRRLEALVRWEHAHEQDLAHLGATIVDTYDRPPLTIVFLSGTLTTAVKRYVQAFLPPEVRDVPIVYIQGPISYDL
jgi:hypothetical protein